MFSRSVLHIIGILSVLVCVMFSIVGNIVPIYDYQATGATVFISPWRLSSCAGYACTVYHNDQITSALGSTWTGCDPSKLQNHLLAAGAYGVITAAIIGASFLTLLMMDLLQRPNRHSAILGLIFGIVNSLNSIISLILVFSVRGNDCITNLNTSVHASGFMYTGSMLFSWLTIAMYAVWLVRNKPSRAPKARPITPRGYDSATRPVAPAAPPMQQMRSTPAIVRSPAPPQQDVWPEGNDWVVDEASGLLWSEEKHLFFDRSSGQFFDPRTDQWFDPEQNRWYKLNQ